VKAAVEAPYEQHELDRKEFLRQAKALPTLEEEIHLLRRKIAKTSRVSAERRLLDRLLGPKEAALAARKRHLRELEVRIVKRLDEFPELPDCYEAEHIALISGRLVAARLTAARLRVLASDPMSLVAPERARRAAEYQATADYYEELIRRLREGAQESTAGAPWAGPSPQR